MTKQSALLQHVFTRAEEMYANDGRSAMTADYFVLAFLQALNDQAADQLSRRLKTATVTEEMTAAEAMLNAYSFSRDTALLRIAEWIHDVGYSATWDEMTFTDIECAVKAAAGGRVHIKETHEDKETAWKSAADGLHPWCGGLFRREYCKLF